MHALRHPRPVSATLVTAHEAGGEVDESAAGPAEPMTEARRVVEPDLLWIESVTDRLLGTAGRPASWERVYFEGRDTVTAAPAPQEAQQPATGDAPSAPEDDPLPQRTPRDFDGPVSYRQPAGYVRPAAVDPLTDPPAVDDPTVSSEDQHVNEPDPESQEPPVSAEPSPVDLAPAEPHLHEVRPPEPATAAEPAGAPHPEDMPPAVLRAALRDALPDVFDLPTASGPADAVFGDPRWSLPAEEDEAAAADEAVPEVVDEDVERLRAAATAEPGTEDDEEPYADVPVQSPYFEPPAPERPRSLPSYADLGYGFPRPADQLTVSDVALRLAFRSEDRDLAEAVVRLVARQARERSRLQTAEAYLDAILDEGDAALPSAARLRHILGD